RARGDRSHNFAAPLPRLRRPIAPDADVPAPRGSCGFSVGLVGDALRQLPPALAGEPLRPVALANPAHRFRPARGRDEVPADGWSFQQPPHGPEGALSACPAGAFWRADAIAADWLQAVEVEVVSISPNRAAGLDARALEENYIPLEQIGRHAQSLGA